MFCVELERMNGETIGVWKEAAYNQKLSQESNRVPPE
jgi:hypothetical protein